MTKSEIRSELDRTFNLPGGTMGLEDYTRRCNEIAAMRDPVFLAAPSEQPDPAKSMDAKFVSHDVLKNFALKIGQILRGELAPVKTTAADIATLQQRIATLEIRCGALAMSLGRSNPDGAAELEKLFSRITTLESRPVMRYMGTWKADTQYNESEFVTSEGSVWYVRRATLGRPGQCDDFQLAVKRGANGKDSRGI